MRSLRITLLLLFAYIFSFSQSEAQSNTSENLKVFVDCRTDCDLTYFRTKVPYIDYVRDQGQANVHVLINSISNGSGGRRYTIQYIPQNDFFEAPIQEINFDIPPNSTRDDIRSAMLNKMTLGLVPLLMNTPAADQLMLDIPEVDQEELEEKNAAQKEFDPWNYWVFETGFDIDADLQSQRRRTNLRTDLDITRVTDEWRIGAFIYYRGQNQIFYKDEEPDIVSKLSRYGYFGRVVNSVGDHWAVGLFTSVSHSNFENINLNVNLGPAIEYNFFPYSEAIYKELTIGYYTRWYYRDYIEETVFGKTQEYLWDQRLQLQLRLRKPWGSVNTRVSARHFFQDFSKNSIEINNNLNIRIIQGLAVRFSTNFELINDQLSLPRGEISLEDLLLAQRQQATDYDLSFSVGLNYTFGSIYNNVINPRL